MQRNFYTDEFEQLIRQKADQYKMYPSDHVWKGVHKALHGRRRWYWAGMAVLLLSVGAFTLDYLFKQQVSTPVDHATSSNISTELMSGHIGSPVSSSTHPAENIIRGNSSLTRVPEYSRREVYTIDHSAVEMNVISGLETNTVPARIQRLPDSKPASSGISLPGLPERNNTIRAKGNARELADAASEAVMQDGSINWLQEYAVYQLEAAKRSKWGWTISFAPTMNYRKLSGSAEGYYPSSEIQSVPLALSFSGRADQYVHHKPALGFELGTHVLYRASKHLQLKFGVQFNYSRYNIEAFTSHPEKAMITLDPYWNGDTIVSYTSVRNMSGYAQQELANQYFQLSLPVGVELRLFGNEKLQLNVAGTVQPTYLLNRNSYLITTDYKNYTREPSLVRRWNINAGVETYIAYNTGTVRWQLGPQFRYQLLSSYVNKYPIRENLMEYGFKIGFSKTIR